MKITEYYSTKKKQDQWAHEKKRNQPTSQIITLYFDKALYKYISYEHYKGAAMSNR